MKKLKLFFPLSIYNTVSTGRLVLGILLHVACFFLVPILTCVSKTDDTNSEDAENVDVEKISGDDLSI